MKLYKSVYATKLGIENRNWIWIWPWLRSKNGGMSYYSFDFDGPFKGKQAMLNLMDEYLELCRKDGV